jgi:hypothetical protein
MNQTGMKLRNGKLLTNNENKKINSNQKIDSNEKINSHEKIDSHKKFIESANKFVYLIRTHSDLMFKLNNVINLYEYILQNIDDFKKFYDNKNKKSLNNFIKVVLNQVINLTQQCVNQINKRISEINADNIIVIQKCINCMDIMWKVYKHIKLL